MIVPANIGHGMNRHSTCVIDPELDIEGKSRGTLKVEVRSEHLISLHEYHWLTTAFDETVHSDDLEWSWDSIQVHGITYDEATALLNSVRSRHYSCRDCLRHGCRVSWSSYGMMNQDLPSFLLEVS